MNPLYLSLNSQLSTYTYDDPSNNNNKNLNGMNKNANKIYETKFIP